MFAWLQPVASVRYLLGTFTARVLREHAYSNYRLSPRVSDTSRVVDIKQDKTEIGKKEFTEKSKRFNKLSLKSAKNQGLSKMFPMSRWEREHRWLKEE